MCNRDSIKKISLTSIPVECFLNAVGPTATSKFDASASLELSISDVFSVPFVGCVVSGVILSGSVKAGDPVMIGVGFQQTSCEVAETDCCNSCSRTRSATLCLRLSDQ